MLTAAEIQSLLVEMLAGAVGGEPDRWRELIGDVEPLPLASNPVSNWRVKPMGTEAEVDAIAMAATIARGEHPYVRR